MKTLMIATCVAALAAQAAPSGAAVLDYTFSVNITAPFATPDAYNPFAGQTYIGAFSADTATGQVTNFSANLLGGSFQAASLNGAAHFDVGGTLTHLTFGSSVTAFDGAHNFAFTSGFSEGQIMVLGLNPANYFAYLDTETFVQGGGTPVFNLVNSAVPEPAAWALMLAGFGFAGAALRGRRRRVAVTFA